LSSLGLVRKSIAGGIREAQNAEEDKAAQAGEADLPALDEAGAGAGRLAVSEVRLVGQPAAAPQDQEEPAA
jgi:hypothetical protein